MSTIHPVHDLLGDLRIGQINHPKQKRPLIDGETLTVDVVDMGTTYRASILGVTTTCSHSSDVAAEMLLEKLGVSRRLISPPTESKDDKGRRVRHYQILVQL